MSLPLKHRLAEILVCIVVAAFLGIMADRASLSAPSPEEASEHILGEKAVPAREALHKKLASENSSLGRMYHYGYDTIVTKHSRQAGLDWRLVASLICQESGFQAPDTSAHPHHGLMQISSSVANIFGIKDLSNPDKNIEAGTRYLRYLMDIYVEEGMDSTNAVKYALAAYNCGSGNIQHIRDSAMAAGIRTDNWETLVGLYVNPDWPVRNYVAKILDRYEKFKIITR